MIATFQWENGDTIQDSREAAFDDYEDLQEQAEQFMFDTHDTYVDTPFKPTVTFKCSIHSVGEYSAKIKQLFNAME